MLPAQPSEMSDAVTWMWCPSCSWIAIKWKNEWYWVSKLASVDFCLWSVIGTRAPWRQHIDMLSFHKLEGKCRQTWIYSWGNNKIRFLLYLEYLFLRRCISWSQPDATRDTNVANVSVSATVVVTNASFSLSASFPLTPPTIQAKSCICHMCGAHLNRLHSCLYCVFFACFAKKHIHEHAKSKRHNLGMRHTHCMKYAL